MPPRAGRSPPPSRWRSSSRRRTSASIASARSPARQACWRSSWEPTRRRSAKSSAPRSLSAGSQDTSVGGSADFLPIRLCRRVAFVVGRLRLGHLWLRVRDSGSLGPIHLVVRLVFIHRLLRRRRSRRNFRQGRRSIRLGNGFGEGGNGRLLLLRRVGRRFG